MDPGEITVKSWTASLYDDDSRRWKYGVLYVTPQFLEFIEDSDLSGSPYRRSLEHSNVNDIKTSFTGLIFRAIVIATKDKTKWWLSSLPDLTSTYNVLQYFQRQNLLTVHKDGKPAKNSGVGSSTEMGRKLLHSVQDSQNTLNNAANLLQQQGTQIESSMATMIDIHNDLDIADNILTGLESWLGKWKLPRQYKKETLEVVHQVDLPAELDYEVLYTKLEVGKMSYQLLGILRVCVDGLFILTDKQKVVQNFNWRDVSLVKVLSLCEMTVTQYHIGKPDLTYALVCTNILPVLRFLDKKLKSKVEYVEDVFKDERRKRQKPILKKTPGEKGELLSTRGKGNVEGQPEEPIVISNQDTGNCSYQVQGQGQIVSNEEVEEISQTLQNIKSVALATQQEMDLQFDNIGNLTSSVDQANQRIDEKIRRIKTLT